VLAEVILTTKNSALSTRWLPSVSNMLNAILNPDCGSTEEMKFRQSFEQEADLQLTSEDTEEEQVLRVADDSLVTKIPEERWRSFLQLWSDFFQLANLLSVENSSLQPGTRLLLDNRLEEVLRCA
jgi:hypothetical protein